MAEKTLEERLSELYEKIDHRDQFFDKDLKTLIDGIRDAREHGGTASVDVTPIVGGYKIVITDSEGVEHVATVKDGGDAYEVYKSTVPEGQSPMTKEEWLETLKGADGAPGHNPCLGRFNVLPTLSPNPFADARKGDYIYFDTTNQQTSDPVTYVYYFDGTDWDTTGTLVDVSNLSFRSGQDIVGIAIKGIDGEDDHKAQGVLSAEAGRQLAVKLEGVTASETKVTQQPITGSYVKGANGSIEPANNTAYIEVALGNAKSVRFLGAWFNASGYTSGYAFGHYTDQNEWVTDKSSVFNTDASTLGTKEYIIDKPDGATHFRTTTATGSVPALAQNFYCYLQSGDTVINLIHNTDKKIEELYSRPQNYQLGYLNISGNIIESEDRCVSDFIEYQDGTITSITFNFGAPLSNPNAYIIFYNADKVIDTEAAFLVNAATRTLVADSVRRNSYVRFSFPLVAKNEVSVIVGNASIYHPEDIKGDIEIICDKAANNLLIYRSKIELQSGQIYTNEGVGNVCNKAFYSTTTTQYTNISVDEGDTFLLINCVGGDGPRQYCFLDSDNIILEVANVGSNITPLTIVAPEHATQLIVNSKNLIGELFKISNYSSLQEYLDGIGLSEYNALDVKIGGIFTDSYYDIYAGAIHDSTTGACRTDYLDISGFEKIVYTRCSVESTATGDSASIVFFDSNHNFISGLGYYQDTARGNIKLETVEVPPNAKYCIIGMLNTTLAEQIVVKGLIKNAEASSYNNRKLNGLPSYTSWRSRYSLMKNFGLQPAADGSSDSFCNALNGGYSDLLTTVYEPLRELYSNYITRTNIGKDASGTIDMYAYDFQPKYYQQHIYLQAGIHADEPEAIGALARIMYLISHAMEGNDDDLKFMRQNVRFTVVPCVNVWGFSQSPKVRTNSESENMQVWDGDNVPQEMQNIKDYILNNELLKEFSFMMDMHTTTSNTYSNFYGALQRHSKNARTIFRVNSWLYYNFSPSRGIIHNEGKDLGYRETSPNIFRMYWYKKGVETFTPEFTDYIWDGNNRCTSVTQKVAVSMYLNYMIQMMNDFYVSMYDVPNSDYHQTAG